MPELQCEEDQNRTQADLNSEKRATCLDVLRARVREEKRPVDAVMQGRVSEDVFLTPPTEEQQELWPVEKKPAIPVLCKIS